MSESTRSDNGSSSQRRPYSRKNEKSEQIPSKEDDDPYLGQYYHQLSHTRYNPISRDEETMLAEKASNGDESARIRLIEANL